MAPPRCAPGADRAMIGFAGTPAFAAHLLAALADANFPIALVLTQPDRPRGRGQKTTPSPVKALARQRAIEVCDPATLASDAARTQLFAHALDVLVVAAYGLLLPRAVLDWPRHGCVNVHASLLPRWRGAAPIQRALLAGDVETGITLMRMDAGLDTGPMLDVARVAIDAAETAGSLEAKLAALGARMLIDYLRRLAAGEAGDADRPTAGRRDLRREDPQGRGRDRLECERDRHRSPGARVRPGARCGHALVRPPREGLASATADGPDPRGRSRNRDGGRRQRPWSSPAARALSRSPNASPRAASG